MPFLSKAWGWFTNNPIAQIITAFVLALVGWEVVRRNIQETGRIQERERQAVANAREQARIAQAINNITKENQDATIRANAAVADLPRYVTVDELRARDPALAAIVFGPDHGSGQ